MYKWTPVLALLASTISYSVDATIYKCIDHDGNTLFSQTRCNTHAETILVRPEFKSITNQDKPGLRKGETKALKKIIRREKARARKRKREVKKANNKSARKERCSTAKKKIRKLKNQRRSGCKSSQCDQIDEQIVNYREQKSRYCY